MSFLYEEDSHSQSERSNVQPQIQIRQQPERASTRVKEECQAALSESLRIAAETNQLAQVTATELQTQTEQIQRIHRDSEITQDNLRTSEFLLKGMKGWWSSLTQLFQEPPKPKVSSVRRVELNSNDVESRRGPQCQEGSSSGGTQKEMSAGLSQLSMMLEEMKHRALATGRELEYQNQELETIHDLTTTNDEMLDKQRRDLEKLMR